MSELSWLVDLIVNYKLTKAVKDRVLERIKEIDSQRPQAPAAQPRAAAMPQNIPPHLQGQSPSTIANFLKDPNTTLQVTAVSPIAAEPAVNMSAVIASPQAAQAMQGRAEAISAAISGKPEKGRTSPRKF